VLDGEGFGPHEIAKEHLLSGQLYHTFLDALMEQVERVLRKCVLEEVSSAELGVDGLARHLSRVGQRRDCFKLSQGEELSL